LQIKNLASLAHREPVALLWCVNGGRFHEASQA